MSGDAHVCQQPAIGGGTIPQQPDWTCGVCGRVWRDCRTAVGTQWWAEIAGPRLDALRGFIGLWGVKA